MPTSLVLSTRVGRPRESSTVAVRQAVLARRGCRRRGCRTPSPAVLPSAGCVDLDAQLEHRARRRRGTGRRRPSRAGTRGARKKSGKRASATSMLPNLMPPAACPSPAVSHPSPAERGAAARPRVEEVPDEGPPRARVRRPEIAMRKRRPQPAMARSGQAGASALMIASAISCAQWLVASVTGARADSAHTTVPWLARSRSAAGTCRRSSACAGRSGRRAPCARPSMHVRVARS